jgi:Putative bacterial sensory transduction regulator
MKKYTLAALGLFVALSPAYAMDARVDGRPQTELRQEIGGSAIAAPAVRRQAVFDLPAIEAALRAAGVIIVDKETLPDGDLVWAMRLAGLKFGMTAYGVEGNAARSLQLNAAFGGDGPADRTQQLAAANDFNLNQRFVTAAVMDSDHNNDIMLEMDLVGLGTVEPRELVSTISGEWMFALMQWATRTH